AVADSEPFHQGEARRLRRQERVGTGFDDQPVATVGGDLAAQAVGSLDDRDGYASLGQLQRSGQAGDPAAHHHDRAELRHYSGPSCSSTSATSVSAKASESLSMAMRSRRKPSFSARARNSMSMS